MSMNGMSAEEAYILGMGYADKVLEQVNGVAIDDENIKPNATWSSEKISRDYSTKEYVAEQISNTLHLVKEIVDAPPTVDEAKENVIYMVKDDTVTSGDVYKEYQLINGKIVQTGDTSIDLSGYAKLEDVENKTEIDDTVTSTETTWSSEKTQEEIENSTKSYFTINTLSNTKYVKIIPDNEQRHITIVSEDGECVEIFGDNDNGDQYMEECPKAVRLSYGAIQSFDASEKTANIERVFYNQTAGSKNFYVDCKSLLGYTIHGVKEQPKLVDDNSAEASQLMQQGLKEIPIISLIPEKDFYRVVAQDKAGYFKFKPSSDGKDQPLRISVTDNYGGMINISGATPSASQYKPFKCIRLSNGEYTNYDAIKVANNKMLKLFYYDGYFYLKVTTYTTCTFTGLIEAPTYVETFDDTDAEEIPIRSVFDTPYNDGYADPSIIVIGDTASSDGIIKTLSTLGFTVDIMTWDTGVYRVSHVGGLTNFPAEITEEKPGFRLEHYDMKKWGDNHNPNVSTYGCRQSVLHYKGDVFVRYTESGATAGVLITDTGWQKLAKVFTTLAELELTADASITDVIKALPIGGKAIISTHEFTNYQTLFPYTVEADQYATLKVEKGYDKNGSRTIVAWIRKDASRIAYGGLDSTNTVKWWNEVSINGIGSKALVTNAQNFKLDITKKSASWYGFIKLEYLYGYHLCEICIGITSLLAYTVTKGKNLVDKITYTVDGANIIFGIDFTSKVYGVQVVEMPSDFGTINSLTAESFTGNTVMNQTGLDVELYPQTKVVTSLDKGTWQVGQRIKQKTDFTANTNDVCFEFVAKNESSSSTVPPLLPVMLDMYQ